MERRLRGLHRVDGAYPTLAPGGSVDGRLLRTDYVDVLDRYEGVSDRLYARVTVPLAGADELPLDGTDESSAPGPERTVRTCVADPDRLGVTVTWPGETPFPGRVREYLADHAVRCRPR